MSKKKLVKLTRNMIMFRIHGIRANIHGILAGQESKLLSINERAQLAVTKCILDVIIIKNNKE